VFAVLIVRGVQPAKGIPVSRATRRRGKPPVAAIP
jgi:hypothetical protein